MNLNRPQRAYTKPKESDTAIAIRTAHNEISRFFDWTSSHNCRMANDWRQQVTTSILAGATPDDAIATIKANWFAHCQRTRTKPQQDRCEPALFARYQEANAAVESGASPQHAAVAYRAIARDFPNAAAQASHWAAIFDAMGTTWRPTQ
jgi:hypothetical protein